MTRPDNGDWTSLRGSTRVNRDNESTPIERLGVDNNISVNNLNVSSVQDSRWLKLSNENDKIPISMRCESIATYDSARGITIGDM